MPGTPTSNRAQQLRLVAWVLTAAYRSCVTAASHTCFEHQIATHTCTKHCKVVSSAASAACSAQKTLLCAFVQWHAGENVGTGSDYTLFSTVDGIVIYSKKKDRSYVSNFTLAAMRLDSFSSTDSCCFSSIQCDTVQTELPPARAKCIGRTL